MYVLLVSGLDVKIIIQGENEIFTENLLSCSQILHIKKVTII